MKRTKAFFIRYRHGLAAVLYGIIYLTWFRWLETTVTKQYTVIHMAIDDHIPFCEVFVIPYYLWFAYIALAVVFFMIKDARDKREYWRLCAFLGTGMTVFLLVSTFWPNGHHLRPFIMPRDNFFTALVSAIYKADTATNLWPSIHVYNSLGVHIAIAKSRHLENHKGIRMASLILCISIILSTMFIKQHSVFDVLTAFFLAAIMYIVVYRNDVIFVRRHSSKPQVG